MDSKKFGAFIAHIRKEKNMTQLDLANKQQNERKLTTATILTAIFGIILIVFYLYEKSIFDAFEYNNSLLLLVLRYIVIPLYLIPLSCLVTLVIQNALKRPIVLSKKMRIVFCLTAILLLAAYITLVFMYLIPTVPFVINFKFAMTVYSSSYALGIAIGVMLALGIKCKSS